MLASTLSLPRCGMAMTTSSRPCSAHWSIAPSIIPMMDGAIHQCAEHGLDEVVIAMPHRGSLDVLANIVGKPYVQIFNEFEGNLNPSQAHGSGGVKYHLKAPRVTTSRCSARTTSRCR